MQSHSWSTLPYTFHTPSIPHSYLADISTPISVPAHSHSYDHRLTTRHSSRPTRSMHHVITTPCPIHNSPTNRHQLSPSAPPSDYSLRYAISRWHQRMPAPHHGNKSTSPSHPSKDMAPTRRGGTITDKIMETIYLLGISKIQQQMAPVTNHQPSPDLHSSASDRPPIPHILPLYSTKVVPTTPLYLPTTMHRH